MLEIILCDDDRFFMSVESDILQRLISDEQLDAEVSCMARSDSELVSFLKNHTGEHLVFLDLDFGSGSPNGIDIAGVIRRLDPHAKLVFTTNHREMAMRVLKSGTEPFGFLEKGSDISILAESLAGYVRLALRDIGARAASDSDVVTLSLIGSDRVNIRRSGIVFVETEKSISHGLTYHTSNGSRLTVLGTMDDAEHMLGDSFLRVHRSYIVGKSHIIGIKNGYIKLSTQDEVPCSLRKSAEVRRLTGKA